MSSTVIWVLRAVITLIVEFLDDYCAGPGKGSRACDLYARAQELLNQFNSLFPFGSKPPEDRN